MVAAPQAERGIVYIASGAAYVRDADAIGAALEQAHHQGAAGASVRVRVEEQGVAAQGAGVEAQLLAFGQGLPESVVQGLLGADDGVAQVMPHQHRIRDAQPREQRREHLPGLAVHVVGRQPAAATHHLSVKLTTRVYGALARSDLSATRRNVEITAFYQLFNSGGQLVLSDASQINTGYDEFDDPLNDISAYEDTIRSRGSPSPSHSGASGLLGSASRIGR